MTSKYSRSFKIGATERMRGDTLVSNIVAMIIEEKILDTDFFSFFDFLN